MLKVPLHYYDQLKKDYDSSQYTIYWINTAYQLNKDTYNNFYVGHDSNNAISLHGEIDKQGYVYHNHKLTDFIYVNKQ